MVDSLAILSPAGWFRLVFIYLHLLLCAFALVEVLYADVRIVTGRFTAEKLRRTAHHAALSLGALWLSGLAIVYLDTGFDPAILATLPKLLLKLLTVSVLTVNGVVLHLLALPIVAERVQPTLCQASLLAFCGALSTSHWLLAAFVGIARPLGRWSFDLLLTAYFAYVGITFIIAMISVPLLRRQLGRGSEFTRPGRYASRSKRRARAECC